MSLKRAANLSVAGTSIRLPCFFPSISSVKTNMQPAEYLDFLVASAQAQFLISAYDVANADAKCRLHISNLLSKAVNSGQVVLIDSGNYEGFWKADKSWEVGSFHNVVKSAVHHLCFCYDNQSPPKTAEAIAEDVVASVLRDQAAARGTVIPIVHGPTAVLPNAVRRVAEDLYPPLIAVPERALGDGILARAAVVRAIRTALNGTGVYIPLHLLGTGNPVSLLIYTLAGADSFDGLEWCQTVVDHRNGGLHHFQHWDFYADQKAFVRDGGLPYIQSVLLHNLVFFKRFMFELAEALAGGEEEVFARKWLSVEAYQKMAAVLAGGGG